MFPGLLWFAPGLVRLATELSGRLGGMNGLMILCLAMRKYQMRQLCMQLSSLGICRLRCRTEWDSMCWLLSAFVMNPNAFWECFWMLEASCLLGLSRRWDRRDLPLTLLEIKKKRWIDIVRKWEIELWIDCEWSRVIYIIKY